MADARTPEATQAHVDTALSPTEPRIYRSMVFQTITSGQHTPIVGMNEDMLGAQLPPAPHADVHPDSSGMLHPTTEGLSVAPSLKALPPGRVPERLRDRRPGARGSNSLRLFRLGEGPFVTSAIDTDLELVPTSKTHGVIRPSKSMTTAEYQTRLAATEPRWNDEG